jgi:hypothetical protein
VPRRDSVRFGAGSFNKVRVSRNRKTLSGHAGNVAALHGYELASGQAAWCCLRNQSSARWGQHRIAAGVGLSQTKEVMSNLIYQAIPKVMAAVGAIEKGRRNTQQNYAFRGIDDVFSAFQRPLIDAGIFYVPEVLAHEHESVPTKLGGVLNYTRLQVAYTFYASDGSNVRAVVAGEAMDSADKSTNKAMSAALKYALLQIFCVPVEQDDADQETHEMSTRTAVQSDKPKARAAAASASDATPATLIPQIRAAFVASGKADSEWGAFFKQEGIGSMPVADLQNLLSRFSTKRG